MSFQQRSLEYSVFLCVLVISSRGLEGQTRFEAVSRDNVAAIPELQVVAVRDGVLNVCYTLFIMQPSQPAGPASSEAASISEAARERDQRLSALTTEFERGISGGVPATIGSNPLKYQWEGDKVQSDYEHLVRRSEMARIEEQLAHIENAPRLAVAGPAPCGAPPASPPRGDR
jgi:hypothetical protein